MRLRYVTLTGADDKNNWQAMQALSDKYPFVEWAILFSQSKAGVPRYPSYDWALDVADNLRGNLAAHLCGKWVDDANKGRFSFLKTDLGKRFGRIQLNMAKDRLRKVLSLETDLWECSFGDKQIILGGPYQKYNLPIPAATMAAHGAVPLFDCSGGRGILTKEWPQPAQDEQGKPVFCGYAGGLGPDNLEEELGKIEAVVGDAEIWVDMESRVRNQQDEFDMSLCERVLGIAQRWA